MPWSGEEYLAIYEEVLKVLEEVDPAVVAIDPMFGPGTDASRANGRREVIISPNSLVRLFSFLGFRFSHRE